MPPSERRLARYLQTAPSSERVEKNWRAVEAALPAAKHRRPAWVAGLVCAAACLLVVLVSRPWGPGRAAVDGVAVETGEAEEQTLTLADGSRIMLEESTRLNLMRVSGDDVRLSLERGAIDANVTHVARRAFTVAAGPFEVAVVGTKFRVARDADGAARVSVTEGRVKLTRVDGSVPPRLIGAGESWSTEAPGHTDVAPTAAPETSAAGPDRPSPKALPVAPNAAPKGRLSWRFYRLVREGHYPEAYDEIGGNERFLQLVAATADPKELFMLAQVARLSEHTEQAAKAFEALRTAHRDDKHAGLAALELGRLRLNELDDPRGAAEALEDAMRLEPNEPFHEDAAARRIEALDQLRDRDACERARDLYLARYPNGTHALNVRRKCLWPADPAAASSSQVGAAGAAHAGGAAGGGGASGTAPATALGLAGAPGAGDEWAKPRPKAADGAGGTTR